MYNVATKQRRDINAAKLEGIISKLGPLVKSSRMDFYKELQQFSKDDATDMLDTR